MRFIRYWILIYRNMKTAVMSLAIRKLFWSALFFMTVLVMNVNAQTPSERDISDIANAIIVTEVNYHPPGSSQDLEFIELYNPTDTTINMTGFELLEGITYDFTETIAARSFLIIAANSQAVQDRFNYQGAISQWPNGSLNNGGEYISMIDTQGKLIFRFRFDDVAPWPLGDGEGEVSPDEGGSSIVLPNPDSDYTDGSHWRVSKTPAFDASLVDGLSIFGSPGELEFNVFGLSSGVKDSDTQITVSFSDNVKTNGDNPGDFTVTDGLGTGFAVSAQADGTAGDAQIVLTVANLSSAIGDLTVTYINNNNEVTDLTSTEIAETSDTSIDLDSTAPTIVSASRDSDTQITLTFDEPVQTKAGNPTDFALSDGNGVSYSVTAQADGTANDNQIVLSTVELPALIPVLTLKYTNNNNEVSDFGTNGLTDFELTVCPMGFTCQEQSENICSEAFTLNSGRVVTYPDPLEFDTVGTIITQYNFTFDRAEVATDVFKDATIAETGSVTYQANTNTTGVLSFDKSQNHWVNLNALQDDLNGKSRSVFMWVKAEDNTSSNQALFAVNAANGDNLSFLWIDDSGDNLEVNRGGTTNESASFNMGGGVWHYVGWSYNHTTGETVVYVNGIENDRFTTGTSVPDLTAQYSLGQEFDGGSNSDFYNGDMAEISVWDEVLTPAEVRAAMRTKITNAHTAYDHLVGYYSIFGECDDNATTLKDHSGKGNDGTFENDLTQDFQNVQSIEGFNAIGWYEDLSWRKDGVEVSAASTFTANVAAGDYEFIATRNFVQSTDAWSMTLNDNASTVDNIADETLCEDDPISRSVTANTVNYLDFERSESNSITLNSLTEDLINTNYSVFLWVKRESYISNGDFQQLIAFQDSDVETTSRLYMPGNERLTIWDGANFLQSPVFLDNNIWHFVGFTYDATTQEIKLYVNDEDVVTGNLNLTITDNWLATLGARYIDNGLTNYLDGQMAEITIWDKVLTEEEIANLRTTAPAHNTDNLVAAYGALPGIADNQLRDLTGNGHDGLASHSTIFVSDQEETFTDYDASANYSFSWKKGETEFDTDATANITVEEGTTAYSVTYGTPLFQKTDVFNLSYTNLIPTEPSDQTEGITGTATFEADEIAGATYQWYKKGQDNWINSVAGENGFPNNTVISVFEANGNIYAATDSGLGILRSGQTEWEVHTSGENSLPSRNLRSVYVSNDDVYVGTSLGLAILRSGATIWEVYQQGDDNFPNNSVSDVYESGGTVYVATNDGLAILRSGAGSWEVYKKGNNNFPDNSVTSVYELNGTIYAGTSDGIAILENGATDWEVYQQGDSNFPSNRVLSVYAVDGIVYAGTFGSGLAVLTGGATSWEVYQAGDNNFPNGVVNSIIKSNGTLYVGTDGGLATLSSGASDWEVYQQGDNGFPNNTVRSVYVSEGTIVTGTRAGLSRFRPDFALSDNSDNTATNQIQGATTHELTIHNLSFDQSGVEYFVEVTKDGCTQVSGDVTLTVLDVPVVSAFTPAHEAIDVAIDTDLSMEFSRTVSKGTGELKLFNYATDALIQSFTADELIINGTTISVTPTSSLDYATHYYVTIDADLVQDDSNVGNLARTDKDDWSFHTVCEDLILTEPEDQTGFVLGSATFSVPEVAGADYQWYQGGNGLSNSVNYTTDNGLPSNNVLSLYHADGKLYAATREGLAILDQEQNTWSLHNTDNGFPDNVVRTIYVADGVIYAGTESGLAISDNGAATWQVVTTNDGLPHNHVKSVYVSNGTIYAGTESGLAILEDGATIWNTYNTTDGFPNNEINSVFASNGIIYVGIGTFSDGGGLMISTDNGVNWELIDESDGLPDERIKSVFKSDNTLYVGTVFDGLAISQDGGSSWNIHNEDNGFPHNQVSSVYVSNGIIYVALTFNGFTVSKDGGATWEVYSTDEGLPDHRARIAYESEEAIYVASSGGLSVFKNQIKLTNSADDNTTNKIQGASTHELTISNLADDFDQTQYFVEVTKETCQEYSDIVTLTVSDEIVDVIPPVDPAITGISDDTGISDSDGITTDQNILVYGTAEPLSTVEVSTQFGPLRSTTTDASGDWVLDIQDITLVQVVTHFTAVAVDQAGNRSSNSNTFTLTPDFAAPAEPVITGISDDTGVSDSDGITTDQNILIYGTAEPNATIEVSTQFGPLRNTTTDANGDWVLDIQDITLVQIVTNFTAEAVDQAGNRSGTSNTFVLTPDFTAPDKPVITGISDDTGINDSDGITTDRNILVYGTAEANATVEISTQFGPLRNTTADANGDWVLDIRDITLVQIVTHFTAEAVDEAGNRSDVSDTFTLTPDFTAPAKPVITGISDDTGSSNSDGVTWDKNILIMGTAEANATVELSTQFGPLRNTAADANGDWVLDITDITLIELVVSLTAEAVDEAGNRSVTSDAFVLTPDFTAPGVTISVGSSSPAGYTIDALFDEEVTGLTLGGINVTGGTAGSLVQNTTSSYSFFVSLSGSTVDIQVSAGAVQDVAGNDNTVSNQLTLGLPPAAGGEGFTSLSEKPKTEEVRLYPNPVRNILTIDLSELTAEAVDVSLYDAAGTPVFNRQGYSQSELKLDVSSYKSGMYIVRLYDGQQVINKKVMVKK